MNMDKLVVEKVMGWKESTFDGDYDYFDIKDSNLVVHSSNHRFSPTENIQDAWMALNKVCKENNWRAVIETNQNLTEVLFKGEMGYSLPHYGIDKSPTVAMCLAVLQSVGIILDEEEKIQSSIL